MKTPPLARYITDWRLTPEGDAVETPTSWLLPVRSDGRATMLKVAKPESDEQSAADLLRYFAGEGAVLLVAACGPALLMERAERTPSLADMALSGADEHSAEILADTVAKLHAPREHPKPNGLTPLAAWFAALFARESEMPILSHCAVVARRLLSEERDVAVLHGDLHHDNVLPGTRGWLAIDPKGLIGERSYEIANLLGNPCPHGVLVHRAGRMLSLAQLYAARLNLDAARILAFALAHAGLAASWSLEDGRDPAYRLRCAEILAPLVP